MYLIMKETVKLTTASFVLLFTICFQPWKANAAGTNDTLAFIHITDPHVCNLTGYHPFFAEKRNHFSKNAEPLSKFLQTVPEQLKSDMVVITGDNIDYYEAETEKGAMLETQIEQYTRLIEVSEVPVLLTLGNHDIASYGVNAATPQVLHNQFNAERARAAWSRNVPCFKDGTYYSRIFDLGKTVIRFIFLDNAYYASEEISDGLLPFIVDQAQLRWLDEQLKASDHDVEIVFMHMPLNYGKMEANKILTEPISEYSAKGKYYNLFSVLEKNSSTAVIFAGHKHINSINNYTMKDGKKLTQVMTGAFGYDPANWRLVKLTKNNIIISLPNSSKPEYIIDL
jgi:3',5'-cyclic AMP phosphodiesterase CpdA